jgi:hypothetical protein
MDERDIWSILAEQGIVIEPTAANRSSWQYAFPMLEATWYGAYDTRNDALRAALRHLLLLAQRSFSAIGQVPTTQMPAKNLSADLATQLETLTTLWRELRVEDAQMGITGRVDREIRIKQVREQIAHLQEQLKQSGDG